LQKNKLEAFKNKVLLAKKVLKRYHIKEKKMEEYHVTY